MVIGLASLAMLFVFADHWTTWLCLRAPVVGWQISEANPLAAWLFGHFGLAQGLWLDTFVTMLALGLLARTRLIPEGAKLALLFLLVLTTSAAVSNNLEALYRIGLTLTGTAA